MRHAISNLVVVAALRQKGYSIYKIAKELGLPYHVALSRTHGAAQLEKNWAEYQQGLKNNQKKMEVTS